MRHLKSVVMIGLPGSAKGFTDVSRLSASPDYPEPDYVRTITVAEHLSTATIEASDHKLPLTKDISVPDERPTLFNVCISF